MDFNISGIVVSDNDDIINDNHNDDNIEQKIEDEDSGDCMKDRDWCSEEAEYDLLLLMQGEEALKERSTRGQRSKYPGQTSATRKESKESNKTHYTAK
ncbi:hypothetical protein JTB14_020913 [Gonioctena quinquepunctata]|nr:hypothetical protein JTB14_020913 [Gonioctena quinquepunctata]